MSTYDTNLGIGLATGMFFHAPKDTTLPTYPTEYIGENGDGTTSETFTATASQTDFTLSGTAYELATVTVNGTEVSGTLSDSTVTISACESGDAVVITYYVSAWRRVGDVTQDGVSYSSDKSTTTFRSWANVIKRVSMTEHEETISCALMDTTEEVLKTVIGEDNVTVTSATSAHGKLITVNLSAGTLPDEEAYLFIMKDGDDTMAIGCACGQIKETAEVTFAPEDTINWSPTITAEGDGLVFIKDDGQTA